MAMLSTRGFMGQSHWVEGTAWGQTGSKMFREPANKSHMQQKQSGQRDVGRTHGFSANQTSLSFLSFAWRKNLVTLPQVTCLLHSEGGRAALSYQENVFSEEQPAAPNRTSANWKDSLCQDKVLESDVSHPAPTSFICSSQSYVVNRIPRCG